MINETLRRFCESPRRWLIVTAGTFAVALVLVMPLVDAYRAGLNEKTGLLADLETAGRVASEMETLEARVKEKLAKLSAKEAQTVDDESMAALRGKFVDLAKETGCSIRRLSVGSVSSRPWVAGDDPIQPTGVAPANGPPAGFVLEWRPVSVSLSGSGTSLRSLLERVADAGMLMHAKAVELYPTGPNRQLLTLDMELWYFTLARRS